MNRWATGCVTVAVLTAAGLGAAWAPTAEGQVRTRTRPERVVQVFAGQSAHIGVSVRDLDAEDAKTTKVQGNLGVLIEEVSEESPAEKAGLRKGDVVVEFDGERVRSTRQFTRLVQESVPERQVAAVVMRDGQRVTLNVQPDGGRGFSYFRDWDDLVSPRAMIAPPAPPAPPPPPADVFPKLEQFFGGSGRLGISIDDLSPQLADYFGTKDGVLVTSVADNSAAAKAGVKAGDVITAIDGSPVTSPADLRRRTQRLDDGDEFTLSVIRDKKSITLKGKVEARQIRRMTRAII
jgi:serine protease Do